MAVKQAKGYILVTELCELLGLMTTADEDFDDMIEVAYSNNAGKIDVNDFIQLMSVTGWN